MSVSRRGFVRTVGAGSVGVISSSFIIGRGREAWAASPDQVQQVFDDWRPRTKGSSVRLRTYLDVHPSADSRLTLNPASKNRYGDPMPKIEHRFDDVWTVRQNLRFSHVDTDTQRVQAIALGGDGRTLSRYAWAFPERSDLFNIDNQAEARFRTGPFAHTLLFGLDYLREDARYDESQLRIVPSINVFAPVYAGTVVRDGKLYLAKAGGRNRVVMAG